MDVQVGQQLWTGAPQELRSRLWMALLALPAFSLVLDPQQVGCWIGVLMQLQALHESSAAAWRLLPQRLLVGWSSGNKR